MPSGCLVGASAQGQSACGTCKVGYVRYKFECLSRASLLAASLLALLAFFF